MYPEMFYSTKMNLSNERKRCKFSTQVIQKIEKKCKRSTNLRHKQLKKTMTPLITRKVPETDVVQQQQPRRSTRKRKPPDRHSVVITGNWWENNVTCSDEKYSSEEPTTVNEALNGPDNEQWKRALDNKYSAHIKNTTWAFTNLPKGPKAIDC